MENESFYNILGELISREGIVDEMINYYKKKLSVGETQITDFNEGSQIRNLLEAFSVDLYDLMEDNYEATKIAFIQTAYGEWLDMHGANPAISLARELGQESSGFVTFSIPEIRTSDIVIPEDTILVCENNGLEYCTDSEAVILAGETNTTVYCSCLTVGEDGNCEANSINLIDDDNIDNSVEVTNPEAFLGGEDYEEDDDYRERLLESVRVDNFGSVSYYQELGDNIDGVHDILLVDDENYDAKILVNGTVKPVPEEVLMKVLTEFTHPEKILLKHTFIVAQPIYKTLNLTLNLMVEYELEEELIIKRVRAFFDGGLTDDGFDFSGCFIGEPINEMFLYSALETLDGVLRASAKNSDNNSELSNLTVNSNEVVKLGNITINQTVMNG